MTLSGKAAIVGIGSTEFSKASGRSELQLSVEAVQHALADCGLAPADVDGLTTFTMDTSSEIAVARELGIPELRFFSRINFGGGGACATVQQAAMAVATGVADVSDGVATIEVVGRVSLGDHVTGTVQVAVGG